MQKRLRTLAEIVRTLRIGKRWSQEDLAKEIGVSRSWVKKLEAERIESPGADKLVRLAIALGISPRELLELVGAAYQEDSLAKHPERFDPSIVQLAEYLQGLPSDVRQAAVRICQSYAILEKSLGTPAMRRLLEDQRRVAEEREDYKPRPE